MARKEGLLTRVWGITEGYVDLPSRVRQSGDSFRWVPFLISWPGEEKAERRIKGCLEDEEDIYFAPCMFSEPHRRADLALPTQWLWADIDRIRKSKAVRLSELLPTILWRTSDRRFQALWQCRQRMAPHIQSAVNEALTKAIGADPAGWDITQVLRVPGTINFKYAHRPAVGIKWDDGPVYEVGELISRLGLSPSDLRPSAAARRLRPGPKGVGAVSERTLARTRRKLPRRAQTLLKAGSGSVGAVQGERSGRLWELWGLLITAGVDEGVAVSLAQASEWNKWKEDHDGGMGRLLADYRRALRKAAPRDQAPPEDSVDEPGETDEEVPRRSEQRRVQGWHSYGNFLAASFEAPRWLIKDIWTAASHGIIGGEPKTAKSTIALCMATAVASGEPLWGRFPVGTPGPALIVNEEVAPWVMQDRLRKIAASMDLLHGEAKRVRDRGEIGRVRYEMLDFPTDLPIHLLNNWGFDLSIEEHRDMLVAKIEEVKPRLVVLDPLYLMLGTIDENSVGQLRPYLKWLTQVRYEYDCAIAVVHHLRKQKGEGESTRIGQRLAGSFAFHGWLDSAIYLDHMVSAPVGEELKLRMSREFRAVAPQTPLKVQLTIGEPGDLEFGAKALPFTIEGQVVEMVQSLSSSNGGHAVPLSHLARALEIDARTAHQWAAGAERVKVAKSGRGWTVEVVN